MKLYSEGADYKLYHGDMLDMLEVIEPDSIDSIITDPPYELNFMGKGWDKSGIAFNLEAWLNCYEVLKPGGYLLAFGGSRTFHRIACAIEDGGFEIRDTIMWLYGSGFPKSMDIGKAIDKRNGIKPIARKDPTGGITGGKYTGADIKGWHSINNWYEYPECKNEWKGWGTALKPSFEPIIVARKPFTGSLVDNVLKYGVGGLNIDECRVSGTELIEKGRNNRKDKSAFQSSAVKEDSREFQDNGRFPANTILTYDDDDYTEVCGGMPYTSSNGGETTNPRFADGDGRISFGHKENQQRLSIDYVAPADSGSAARYFYCAKASKKDRDEGLDLLQTKSHAEINGRQEGSAGATRAYGGGTNPFLSVSSPRKNTHPTVKPCDLMQYLIRLVTPNGGTVLDPFNGSGSTGKAVMYENKEHDKGYKYIGIELTEEYLPISKARIEYAINAKEIIAIKETGEQVEQLKLF